jgi:uncharacterized protein (DUF927 family)
VFLVARFDMPDGTKEVLPLTLWRDGGRLRWLWKAPPKPRPLYGLDDLARRPAARVLAVEGEKAAVAAGKHLPNRAVVTWSGGSKAWAKTDWRPLAGRDVVVWPDADKAGRDASQAVARAARAAGAASVAIVSLPVGLPEGWDLADDWPSGFGFAAALALLDEAERTDDVSDVEWPAGFRMEKEGLYFDLSPSGAPAPPRLLSGPFEIVAKARDPHGRGWSKVLRFRDPDGAQKIELVPEARLASSGAEVRAALADVGLFVSPARGKADLFAQALAGVKTSLRMTLADATGWGGKSGETFVMPHRTIGPPGTEAVLFTGEARGLHYDEKGELASWRAEIAQWAVGNDLLMFVLSLALSGPLLKLLGMEGGGFHIRGASSSGKTTLAQAAGSAWGGGGPQGFAHTWKATANGLEGLAAGHSDGLLILDELHQVSPDEAGDAIYMLAGGQAKARAQTNGTLRRRAEWRVPLLSTGEITLASLLEASRRGDRVMAGQELRLIDLPADAGEEMGVWQVLHGFESPAALSDAIRASAGRNYGHAGPAFLEAIVRDRESATAWAQELVAGFVDRAREVGDTGQAERGLRRFASVAAAGELAVRFGVVPWKSGMASDAALALFRQWAAIFGRRIYREEREILVRVRDEILKNQSAFAALKPDEEGEAAPSVKGRDGEARQMQALGYRAVEAAEVFFCFHAEGWKRALKGLDARAAAKILAEAGYLKAGEDGRFQRKTYVKAEGARPWLYWVRASILEADFGE